MPQRMLFVVLVIGFLVGLRPVKAQGGDGPLFLYRLTQYRERDAAGSYHDPLKTEIRWLSPGAPADEAAVEVPAFTSYAFSPAGTHLAFTADRLDGHIYILDLLDQSLAEIALYEPAQEFLWDEHAQRSGTLLWSPDGARLAFTGLAEPPQQVMGDPAAEADVYLYTLATGELTNLTAGIPVLRTLITPASWSPDGHWLAVYGTWAADENNAGDAVPHFASALLAPEDGTFWELANGANTCRLHWSADGRWLASETNCFEGGHGGSSGLMLIPFDPLPIAVGDDSRRLDQVVGPLRLGWAESQGMWSYRYDAPLWLDATTVVATRRLSPMTFGYLPAEQTEALTVDGLVAFDVSTYSETLLPCCGGQRVGHWYFAAQADGRTRAFNPLVKRQVDIPAGLITCPLSYAVRLEEQADYLAVLDVCTSDAATYALRVYDTATFSAVFTYPLGEAELAMPLGFTSPGRPAAAPAGP